MHKSMIAPLFLVGLLLFSSNAHAANYDVCGTLSYWDSRSNRSDLPGSKLGQPQGQDSAARRVIVYLWDQNGSCNDNRTSCGETDDIELGWTYSGASDGTFCFYNINGAYDVYYLTEFWSDDTEVRLSDGSSAVVVSQTSWNFANVSSENPDGGDITKNWSITCYNNPACGSQYLANFYPLTESMANILQSAVDVDVLVTDSDFQLNGPHGRITLYYPDDPGQECDGYDTRAFSCSGICIEDASSASNHAVAHEIGHVLMRRALDKCGGYLADGTTGCGNHFWTSEEDEKCAVSEGWADFVAAATYWERTSYHAWFGNWMQRLERKTTQGNNGSNEQCVSMSYNRHRREGNVARFFWDLWDAVSFDDYYQGYSDTSTIPFSGSGSLLRTWDEFPPGTANRRAEEDGPHGRNAYDFVWWEPAAESELYLNCLTSQDPQ